MATTDEAISMRRLKEVFVVTDDGRLLWRTTMGMMYAGKEAGCVSGRYRKVRIDGRIYESHRIIYALYHGVWPKRYIDHIDGDGMNNRRDNLRDVSPSVNSRNRHKPQTNNKLGLQGVTMDHGRYRAVISHGGRQVQIGSFGTPEEAASAYREAKRRLHPEAFPGLPS